MRVVITEGVRTTVDGVTFAGNQAVPEETLRGRVALQPGAPYVPGQLAVDRDAIQLTYQDLGYESATVDARPEFSQDGTHVAVTFAIREGPQVFVDHVLIVGNVRTEDGDDRAGAPAQARAIRSASAPSTTASGGWRRSACSGARASPSCGTATRPRAICS